MKLFLDTSSLFKLYHKENDSDIIRQIFIDNKVRGSLSEIAKIEFHSTVWKKARTGDFTEAQVRSAIGLFTIDSEKYNFVPVDNLMVERAKKLIDKYGLQGLRTLDSIQLATAISLRSQCDLFVTTDKLLHSFFMQESLPVL